MNQSNSAVQPARQQDALSLFSQALSAPNSEVEKQTFADLYAVFESQPQNLPILLPSIVPLLERTGGGAYGYHRSSPNAPGGENLRRFIIQTMDLAFCRGLLSFQTRDSLATHVVDAVLNYLYEPGLPHAKLAIQCFASAYSALFRQVCTDRSLQTKWPLIEAIKKRINELFDADQGVPHLVGIKVAIIKAFQRIILAQTKLAPGEQSSSNDANLLIVPPNHTALRVSKLEAEANKLLTSVITLQYTSKNTDLVMAAMNTLSTLAKFRSLLGHIVCQAMIEWTPAALAGCSYNQIRNVEKTLRLNCFHVLRHNAAGNHAPQIAERLEAQKVRMEAAAIAYTRAREAEAKRKRESLADEFAAAASSKRPKIESGPAAHHHPLGALTQANAADAAAMTPAQAMAAFSDQRDPQRNAALAYFDVTSLPLPVVIDLIIANLQSITQESLEAAAQRTRANLSGETQPAAAGLSAKAPIAAAEVAADPLAMDVEEVDVDNLASPTVAGDDDDDDHAPANKVLENFALAAPEQLTVTQAVQLVKGAIGRMCELGAEDWVGLSEDALNPANTSRPLQEPVLWASLVVRLATRGFALQGPPKEHEAGADDQLVKYSEDIRKIAHKFVIEDPARRLGFAHYWLMEEWTCDRKRRKAGQETHYERILLALLRDCVTTVDAKDRWFVVFVLDLPWIPEEAVKLLQGLCQDKGTMPLGFGILRDLAISRPPMRENVGDVILAMTRSEDGLVRRGAITSARGWVGQGSELEKKVLEYARSSLQVLVSGKKAADDTTIKVETAVNAEEPEGEPKPSQEPEAMKEPERKAEPEVKEEEAPPAGTTDTDFTDTDFTDTDFTQADVLRYLELSLALCIKVPSLLDEVFESYPNMPEAIQKAVEVHIAPLVSSMGPNNPKLQMLLRHFPPGADSLALCVFRVLSDKGRSAALIDLVKTLVAERDVDPRFLVPILPDLAKVDILKHLPKVISVLNQSSSEENVQLIRQVFQSIVVPPAEGFGSVSTNLPRVKQTELLTPTELMGLLHRQENDIGIKAAAQAVEICFNMTTVFRAEVLGAILNQILEEPTLPTIFMRTVIRSVERYRSLSTYVAGSLLTRLITKKIWLEPPLWKGFIICARKTAPASYAALSVLPKEQIKDIAAHHPDLRAGLQEFFTRRVSSNPARLNGIMELLGEVAPISSTPSTPLQTS